MSRSVQLALLSLLMMASSACYVRGRPGPGPEYREERREEKREDKREDKREKREEKREDHGH